MWGATPHLTGALRLQRNFNPRTPCGVRPDHCGQNFHKWEISIHAPRVGCDSALRPGGCVMTAISIHAPRVGCDRDASRAAHPGQISIHAPRVGCDRTSTGAKFRSALFQSTHPVWGATNLDIKRGGNNIFQSTHPVWGATVFDDLTYKHSMDFNPRTPCGVRLAAVSNPNSSSVFQSTHPVWGATVRAPALGPAGVTISIHAPRVGCDYGAKNKTKNMTHFNPRTPCGVRRCLLAYSLKPVLYFNPRTPCGVRPYNKRHGTSPVIISIHAPRVGCDY